MRFAPFGANGVRICASLRARVTIIACLLLLALPPTAAQAWYTVQYVGPPPAYFCCFGYGGSTTGFAPRLRNSIWRTLGSGVAGLIYSTDSTWLTNTSQNPFVDLRDTSYAKAGCSNRSSSSGLQNVTCSTRNP